MLTPEYEAAVARERHLRLEAYLPWAQSILGCPVVPLTWRHLIELSRAGNAFFSSVEPTKDDVFDVLWRLSPAFRRPDGELPNLDLHAIARGARRPGRMQAWQARMIARYCARHLNANAIEFIVRGRLNDAFMDRPQPKSEDGDEKHASPLRAVPTWFDYVASEFSLWGHNRDQLLDYSVAWTFQMLRVQGIKCGRHADYIPPSAALIGPPLAPHPDAGKEVIFTA